MKTPYHLEIIDLAVSFGEREIFCGLNLTVPPGTAIFILGPNGAGKTTLINVISGTVSKRLGRILVAGKDISGEPQWKRAARYISRSFQIPRLSPELTAFEHILLAAGPRRNPEVRSSYDGKKMSLKKKSIAILEDFGLGPMAHSAVSTLTHAERKLVEVATAFTREVPIILLDEPASGLDQSEKELLAQGIGRRRLDHALLIVEHDLDFISSLGFQVIFLLEGQLAFEGSLQEVREFAENQDVYF